MVSMEREEEIEKEKEIRTSTRTYFLFTMRDENHFVTILWGWHLKSYSLTLIMSDLEFS